GRDPPRGPGGPPPVPLAADPADRRGRRLELGTPLPEVAPLPAAARNPTSGRPERARLPRRLHHGHLPREVRRGAESAPRPEPRRHRGEPHRVGGGGRAASPRGGRGRHWRG